MDVSKLLIAGCLSCSIAGWAQAQSPGAAPQKTAASSERTARAGTGFQLKTFEDDDGSHKYSVFIPRNYTPDRKWPVILFLHGAGERGNDGLLPTYYGIGPLIRLREANFPFVVVFPQCEDMGGRMLKGWCLEGRDGKRALKILNQVEKDFSIDTDREILTGWSMGGCGAWEMAKEFPDRWHAVVPLAGVCDTTHADKLTNVPIWAWHGAGDKAILPCKSEVMVEAVRKAGGHVRYTEPVEAEHNVWKQAYDHDPLYAWMLQPNEEPSRLKAVTWRAPVAAGQKPADIPQAPFVPGLSIPCAARVRLGNDVLASLADSVPHIVPAEVLAGKLDDISDSTPAQGRSFRVRMTGLKYQGKVSRATVKGCGKDLLNVQLALSDVQVTIGGTSLTGARHRAHAGPIQIVIGHKRPVWLSIDVTPEVVDQKLKFRHVATRFSIPDDNWRVSSPSGVTTKGIGMTEAKVSKGLVDGLYAKKRTLERQIGSVIPHMISQLERTIEDSAANPSSTVVWPFPVYQPRMKFWPADVCTDEHGVSLVLGATAAQIGPAAVKGDENTTPKEADTSAPPARRISKSTKLEVNIDSDLLRPLSKMMVDAGVARIHVADTPSEELAKLADPAIVAEAIPDLKRYGDKLEVWSELVVTAPLRLVDDRDGDPMLEAPRIKLLVSIKTDPSQAVFTPCAEFDLSLRHAFRPKLATPSGRPPLMSLAMEREPKIEIAGRFADSYQPLERTLDAEPLRQHLSKGWTEFLELGGTPRAEIPDIDLGYAKLRVQEAGWKSPDLFAVFGPPGVKITNSSDRELVYETKGPYSGWSNPYRLAPGETHDFPVSYPIVFRRQTAAGYQMNTLATGSHSEFRANGAASGPALVQYREALPEIVAERPQGAERK